MGEAERDDRKWLLVPIEIQVRELESRFLLAQAAASRGYRVLLGEQTHLHRSLGDLPRGILYEKSISINRAEHLAKVRALGHRVTVSDEETNMMYNDPNKFFGSRLNAETLGLTDQFFCWSRVQQAACVERFPEFAETFRLTGTNRADIWRPEFRSCFEAAAAERRAAHGRYLLFCSSFGAVNHHTGPDYWLTILAEHGKLAEAGAREHIEGMIAQRQPNLKAFAEAMPVLHERFPEHRIVIRPHPVEDFDYWRRACDGLERCVVTGEGLATSWILGAEALFHHGCTTGVEASLLGKTHVVYSPFPDKVHDEDISTLGVKRAKTLEELVGFLRRATEGDPAVAPDASALAPYFESLEGRFAYEKLLDAFDALPVEPSAATEALRAGRLSAPKPDSLRRRVKRMITGGPDKAADFKIKWHGVTEETLQRLARLNSACRADLRPVKIRAATPVLFEIEAA